MLAPWKGAGPFHGRPCGNPLRSHTTSERPPDTTDPPRRSRCALVRGRARARSPPGETLPPGGVLFVYGPFTRDGAHTSDGNAAFDASLRQRDPRWGYRDVADVSSLAAAAGLERVAVVDMPANNFSLVFRKR
jgi:hypothetical protein